MSGVEKTEVLATVASSGLPKRETLAGPGIPKSTYYRWLRRKEQRGLEDHMGGGNPSWGIGSRRGEFFAHGPIGGRVSWR